MCKTLSKIIHKLGLMLTILFILTCLWRFNIGPIMNGNDDVIGVTKNAYKWRVIQYSQLLERGNTRKINERVIYFLFMLIKGN